MKPLKTYAKNDIIKEIKEVIENLTATNTEKQFNAQELLSFTEKELDRFCNMIQNDGEYIEPEIDNTPYEKIKQLWNDICINTNFKQISQLTPKRMKSIKARYRDMNDMEEWKEMFKRIGKSEFLNNWKNFNFDWFICSKNNFAKVRDGNYSGGGNGNNKRGNNQGQSFERGKAEKADRINRFKNPAG